MGRTFTLTLTLILAIAATGAWAGSTIFGLTGLIETPNDQVAEPSAVNLAGSYIADIDDSNVSIFTYGGVVGIIPKLEVGVVGLDSDARGAKTQALLNFKYRLLDETVDRPSVTVGVVDLTNRLDEFDSGIGDPSGFVVVGRNLTSVAESFGGVVSKPLRGTIGLGTGVYKGLFAGLNWSLSSKIDLMAEYVTNGVRQDSSINAGLRVSAMGGLSLEVGAFDLKDFYGGASYTISTY